MLSLCAREGEMFEGDTCIKMIVSLHCSFWCIGWKVYLLLSFVHFMFPFHVYATMWLINQKCFVNKPFYFQTPKNLMTNSLLLSSLDTEISLTLALVALFTLIFCLVAFLQSALCVCSCFLTPDSTIHLYFMSVRQLLNYFLARSNGGMRERYGNSEQMLEKKNNFIFLRLYSLCSFSHL